MAYTNEPVNRVVEPMGVVPVAEYHDLVRWGPIIAGLVTAISSQLVLTALGAAIGLTTLANSGTPQANAGDVGSAVGIWSIISLFISLFLGGWVTSRACGPMNRKTALLNGAILWATTLAVSAWLISSGVSGAFGIAASNAGEILNQTGNVPSPADVQAPNVTTQEAQNLAGNSAKVGWSFALGSLLGLAASMIGAAVGARSPRSQHRANDRTYTNVS
jgi:hypothetical protein